MIAILIIKFYYSNFVPRDENLEDYMYTHLHIAGSHFPTRRWAGSEPWRCPPQGRNPGYRHSGWSVDHHLSA